MVPKKEILLVVRSLLTLFRVAKQNYYKQLKAWVIFQNTHGIKSLFPYKDRLNRSQMFKVVYKASCWDCQDLYIGKTKRKIA